MTSFQKRFRSNELSVKCHFGHLTSFSNLIFGSFSKYFRSNNLLINFVFGQMTFFGKMNFRSNDVRLNGDSVKCHFGHLTSFSNLIFGSFSKYFRSNDLLINFVFGQITFKINFRSNGVRLNGDSVK
jgi:hypothetical protein